MSICLGKRGKWCIYATYPVFQPKIFSYRWPGESWITVPNADTYSVQDQSNNTYYITGTISIFATVFGGPETFTATHAVEPKTIQGRYIGFDYVTPLPVGQRFNTSHFRVWLNYNDRFTGNVVQDMATASGVPDYWFGRAISRTANLNVQITASEQKCRFRVFSQTGVTLVDQTRNSGCPEVEVIPESCTFPNPEVFVRDYLNSNISSYAIVEPDPNNSKCVFVNVAIPSDPLIETPPISNLAYLCGDCAAPQIRIDCECDPCFEKLCPPGTVNRILVGNEIQCVDGNHCVIATLPYDPNCETPNCFC